MQRTYTSSILLTEGTTLVFPPHEGRADEARFPVSVPGLTGFICNTARAVTGHTLFNHTALTLGYDDCGGISALLAFSAIKNNDRVGLLIFVYIL